MEQQQEGDILASSQLKKSSGKRDLITFRYQENLIDCIFFMMIAQSVNLKIMRITLKMILIGFYSSSGYLWLLPDMMKILIKELKQREALK